MLTEVCHVYSVAYTKRLDSDLLAQRPKEIVRVKASPGQYGRHLAEVHCAHDSTVSYRISNYFGSRFREEEGE